MMRRTKHSIVVIDREAEIPRAFPTGLYLRSVLGCVRVLNDMGSSVSLLVPSSLSFLTLIDRLAAMREHLLQ
jgi:hypothetical protein